MHSAGTHAHKKREGENGVRGEGRELGVRRKRERE